LKENFNRIVVLGAASFVPRAVLVLLEFFLAYFPSSSSHSARER
jgi:hypothetical protein